MKEPSLTEQYEKLLTQDDVAKILGVSTKTLEYWRWQKTGPNYIKLGRLVRYMRPEIDSYIKYLAAEGSVH